MTELTLELFLSIFLPVTFFIAALILGYLRSIDKTMDRIGVVFGIAFKDEVLNYYQSKMKLKEETTSNPHSNQPSEKDILLGKLRDGSITPDEARKLHVILEREAAEARAKGAVGALLAILGLLALLTLIGEALSD